MADAGRDEVGRRGLGARAGFPGQPAEVDLTRGTRLPGWRAQEVCGHLGAWPDRTALAGLVADARAGGTGTPADPDTANARVPAAHRDASPAEVLGALRAAREATVRYLADEPEWLDTAPTVSTVGRLPMLSVVLGQAYELAVHGLDLVSAGAPAPPAEVLQSGIAALADLTGALAAAGSITAGVALATPDGGWAFATDDADWS